MAKAKTWAKRIVGGVFSLGVAGLLVFSFLPKPLPVDMGRVKRGPLVVTVDEDGKTRVEERYLISAPLSGTLGRLKLHAGDGVETGTEIAAIVPAAAPLLDERSRSQLEARALAAEAMVKQSDATAERARMARSFADKELERIKGLVESGALAARELEQAELEAKSRAKEAESAAFGVRVARYELENARAALTRTSGGKDDDKNADKRFSIHAPVQGKVLRVLQENEGIVAAGTPLVEIGDPAALEVVVDVLTTDAVQIKPGAKVMIERWGGPSELSGKVRRVEPSAFTKVSALGVEEQRVNVLVDLEGPLEARAALGDGFRVEAQIVVFDTKDALLVPASALFRSGGDWAVFVVEGGRAKVKKVVLGRRTGTEAIVEQGLADGELVILHPSDSVREGTEVVTR